MTRSKHTKILWLSGGAALLALFGWLLLAPGSFLHAAPPQTLNISSAEAMLLMQYQVVTMNGPKPVTLKDALRDAKQRKVYLQLLFGQKLSVLKTTNANLADLGIALIGYSPCDRVIISGGVLNGSNPNPRFIQFGPFDSANYRTRWSAAGAIRKMLAEGGWHVERLNDGKVAILSQNDLDLVRAAKSFVLQSNCCERFDHSTNAAQQQDSGRILSHLWRAGFLDDNIKGKLAEKYYRLVVRQLPGDGWPSWDVRIAQTFPFPDVQTEFTPTLYRNDTVVWSPGSPQMGCAMDVAGRTDGNPVASMSGGQFSNGDVLQLKIELSQKIGGRVWKKTLWTNKITLQGLRN